MSERTGIADLQKAVRELIGQECWDAYLPDGLELHLEIGERRRVATSTRAIEMGSYGIIVGASSWHVSQPEDPAATEGGPDIGLTKQLDLVRGTISAAQVLPPLGLRLEFVTRVVLDVIPHDVVNSTDVPLWELFLPSGSLFQVHPGGIITSTEGNL